MILPHHIPSRVCLNPYTANVKYMGQPCCCFYCNWLGHKDRNCPLKDACGRCGSCNHLIQIVGLTIREPSAVVFLTVVSLKKRLLILMRAPLLKNFIMKLRVLGITPSLREPQCQWKSQVTLQRRRPLLLQHHLHSFQIMTLKILWLMLLYIQSRKGSHSLFFPTMNQKIRYEMDVDVWTDTDESMPEWVLVLLCHHHPLVMLCRTPKTFLVGHLVRILLLLLIFSAWLNNLKTFQRVNHSSF